MTYTPPTASAVKLSQTTSGAELLGKLPMRDKPTVKIISMCHKAHADVWRLTSELLPDYLKADEFVVYVPGDEVAFFEEITDPKIQVLSQETLGIAYRNRLWNTINAAGNATRFGWYLQQFYKIEALSNHSASADILVIWDADCVPLREIPLVNKLMQILYMNASTELHKPYFDNIDRLLGLKRVQSQTFVIPAFPIRNLWITEFVDFIEAKHGCLWADAIINTTDFSLQSGFSETETLGTWVANSYPTAWAPIPGKWERLGQSQFGHVTKFDPEQLLKIGQRNDLDIVTFEHWDKRGPLSAPKRAITKLMAMIKRLRAAWRPKP